MKSGGTESARPHGTEIRLVDLITIAAGDGRTELHLSALLAEEQVPAETAIPKGAQLAVWHDESPLFDEENPNVITGRISATWPILIGDGSYFVAAGEVEDGICAVWLRYSEPRGRPYKEQLVRVVDVRGRRVWMAQPEKMRRRTLVEATWLHETPDEAITVDPIPAEE